MKIDKILRWIVLIGIFAIPLTVPFVVAGAKLFPFGLFFPFITGKAFVFRIIVEIIFVAWILLAMSNKEYRPRFSYILSVVGIFIGVLFLADIFAQNPQKAFWSNYERMEGFVSLFHMALYFIIAGSTLIAEKLWLNFFRINVIASVALSMYGFLQLAGKIVINQGGVRVDGTFGNAAYFGGYMMMMIFLTLFLLLRDNKSWWKWFYIVAIVFDAIILYNSATRGALLGLIGGLILSAILVFFFGKENQKLKKISLGLVVVIVLFSGIFYALRDSNFIKNHGPLARLTSIDTNSADANARFMVWGMAWQGFKEKPILGWGQEGFNFVFNKYYNPEMYQREQWFDRTHNIVFDWLIAGGILGFLSYFSLVFLFFASIWGCKRMPKMTVELSLAEKAVLTGLGAGYVFQNFFVFDNIMSYIVFFSLLAFLHWNRSKPITKIENFEVVPSSDINRFYLPILIVVLAVVIWFVNVRSILASNDLIKSLSSQPEGLTKNIEYFKKAVERNGLGNQEIREQLAQAAVTVINSNNLSITNDVKIKFATLAISELKKQIDEVPSDARTQLFLGQLYSVTGDVPNEIKHYEEALKNSPNKQLIQLTLASSYMKIGDYQKALEIVKKAYEKTPQFSDVAIGYLTIAIYVNDKDTIGKILAKSFGGKVPIDNRIIKAFLDTKQFNTAIALTKEGIKAQPDDFQLRLNLAASYLQAGMRTLAVGALRDAISKNPDFKAQGELYIKEIEAGRNP